MRFDVLPLVVSPCLGASPVFAQTTPEEDGAALERRMHVQFAVMPSALDSRAAGDGRRS